MLLEVAPNGYESQRDVLPDELPPIKELSEDFKYLLSGYTNNRYRINTALEYADHLRARFEPGMFSIDDPEYAKTQVLPRLYLDSMLITARRQYYQSLMKRSGDRQAPNTLYSLMDLISAKLDLQKDISDYVNLNQGESGLSLFGNLAQVMHHSRRILYGDEVMQERGRQENLSHLCGMLAEYKVLSALHEDWPMATFGSVEQDTKGTDIVIPSQHKPHQAVALQVKSMRNGFRELSISSKDVVVPVVRVPMDPVRHDPMRLSREHTSILKRFVQTAPTYEIAFAA